MTATEPAPITTDPPAPDAEVRACVNAGDAALEDVPADRLDYPDRIAYATAQYLRGIALGQADLTFQAANEPRGYVAEILGQLVSELEDVAVSMRVLTAARPARWWRRRRR